MYQEILAKTALHKIKNKRLPYAWDLNIYRGCGHRCIYCYALYSHRYLEKQPGDFYSTIYVKKNIAEILEKRLGSKRWKKELINIGGVTDSYQPIEKQYRLTREVLKVMLKYQNPIALCTKSNLILRDLDLLKRLAKKTQVKLAFTITSLAEEKRKIIEPGTVCSLKRFEAIKKLNQQGLSTGVHFMPIIPGINDSKTNIENIFKLAQYCGATYVLPGFLNLKKDTRPEFYQRLNRSHLKLHYRENYKQEIYQKIDFYSKKYKMPLYKRTVIE